MASCVTAVTVEEMSVDAGRAMFDAQTRDLLGISRVEFLERLDHGQYEGTDSEDIIRLRIIAPFGR